MSSSANPSKDNSSVDKVLRTPELLHSILQQVPVHTLFPAQGVSHSFRNAIRVPLKGQQALFIQPINDNTKYLVDLVEVPGNKLLQERVCAAVPANSPEVANHNGPVVTPVEVNPGLLCPQPRRFFLDDLDSRLPAKGLSFSLNLTAREIEFLAINDNDAMDMFLTQPPVNVVVLQNRSAVQASLKPGYARDPRQPSGANIVVADGGVRLRHIWEAIHKMGRVNPETDRYMVDLCGDVVVTEPGDEKVVRGRTAKWRAGRDEKEMADIRNEAYVDPFLCWGLNGALCRMTAEEVKAYEQDKEHGRYTGLLIKRRRVLDGTGKH